MNTETTKHDPRGSASLWLQAALEALLEGGVEAVRIQPLANKLNLARTSFYWSFKDRETLLAALLNLWRERNTGSMVERAGAYAENIVEAMLNVIDCWLEPSIFDPRLEHTVRSWALQSPEVLAAVREADDIRVTALKEMFVRMGQSEEYAEARALTAYLTQIGYITMQANEDFDTRMPRISTYVEIYTGIRPNARELSRFYARHGYTPKAPAA